MKAGAGAVTCDDTIAQLGDGCDEENEVACQVDKKAALECHKNVFTVGETCKGPKGCVVNGEKISCDNDIADTGDPCHFDGDYACSSDNKMAFKCTAKVMTPLNSCRGDKGCRVVELAAEHKVEFICDDSLAVIGDPCDEEGEHACSDGQEVDHGLPEREVHRAQALRRPRGLHLRRQGRALQLRRGEGGHRQARRREGRTDAPGPSRPSRSTKSGRRPSDAIRSAPPSS